MFYLKNWLNLRGPTKNFLCVTPKELHVFKDERDDTAFNYYLKHVERNQNKFWQKRRYYLLNTSILFYRY